VRRRRGRAEWLSRDSGCGWQGSRVPNSRQQSKLENRRAIRRQMITNVLLILLALVFVGALVAYVMMANG
jgi:hypothetical protein